MENFEYMGYFQYKIYNGKKEKYLNIYGNEEKINRKLNAIIKKPIRWDYIGKGYRTLRLLQQQYPVRHIHGFEERMFNINKKSLNLIEYDKKRYDKEVVL